MNSSSIHNSVFFNMSLYVISAFFLGEIDVLLGLINIIYL